MSISISRYSLIRFFTWPKARCQVFTSGSPTSFSLPVIYFQQDKRSSSIRVNSDDVKHSNSKYSRLGLTKLG